MKNNKWFIPILAIFILFCSSCNNALNNQFEKALDKDEAAEKTATLYFSINGSSSRNILPDTSLANFSDFVLTGTVGDSEVQSLGSWESAQAMTAGSVTVAPGVWNLILTAKKGTDNFSATATVTLEDGGSAVASFVLASAETTGVANITLRYPKNTDITGVIWKFRSLNDSNYITSLSQNDNTYQGICYRNYNSGGTQSFTDEVFTLQKELPPGKYYFECGFYIDYTGEGLSSRGDGCALFGEYCDYIVIQKGFESKLDYTIDYFEATGVTNAVSTEQGMQLTLEVPKGVKDIMVMRINNYNYSNNKDTEEEEMMKAYTIIHKELEEATTEHTTMTILDPCGYTTSDSLTYGVYFDMESFSSVIKTYRSAYNLPVSLFTTYPEFAVETDAEGTKIKITNSASVDWDGRSIYIGSNSYTMIMPEYVFDKDKTELPVNTKNLYPGANPLNCYRLVVKRDGWEYNYNIDNENLEGENKLPVLQGPAPAVATNEGISIRVYCDNHGGYVSLLRTTEPDDEDSWVALKSNVYVDGYFNYVDKCNLVKDTTYYYKVIDDWDHVTYGGEYFSAIATVNKGPFATIQTQPTLSMEDNSATITAGTFQLADPDSVDYIQTVYEYVEENNENRKLLIKYMDYTERSDEIKAEYYIYQNGGCTSSWGSNNQIEVYYESVDGEKYIFNSAYVEFFEESYYNSAKLFKLDFTPTQGNYPAEIQIPNRKVGLALQATDDGVVLTITNIPEGASSIRILSTETYNSQYPNIFGETRSYMFSGDKLSSYITSGTMTFTDKYVNEQQQYYYKVTVYKTSAGYNSSDVCSITATGGSDEIGISQMPVCTFDSESNAVTYTQAASLTSQDDFPEDTYFNIRFNYRDYDDKGNWSNSGSFYYSSSISNYTSWFNAWVSGTYIPYNATLEITFPDYEYTESNVSIPANSSLPQQVVVVES